jgi:hypothetical protein
MLSSTIMQINQRNLTSLYRMIRGIIKNISTVRKLVNDLMIGSLGTYPGQFITRLLEILKESLHPLLIQAWHNAA